MQMYEVSFQVHYEDIIDHGKVLVCASSNDKEHKIFAGGAARPR